MKFLIILLPVITLSMAQRPSYAGTRPIGRPELHSRFRDPNESSTTVDLTNRLGEGGSTPKIPIDARDDQELVNRLNQWPREHRPFWLLNAEAIEAHRNNPQINNPNSQENLQTRSSFGAGDTIPVRPELPRSSFVSASRLN